MGVVYKARQVKLKRLVALKMILAGAHAGPKELARFRIEAEAVARMQHPNIVQIYEIGEHDGLPFFSLEFVEGGTLEAKMGRKPMPFDEAAQLIETLARAVHVAHQRGIVHRDLKPANVLLTPQGQPKITDFGVAKQLDAMEGQTGTGAIMGTPIYMAPEQAAGKAREIGPATDVYSLGAMLYVMLTGQPPFRGETAFDTIMLVIGEEPPPPSQFQPKVPRDLETICLKCLRKAPSRRYASAEELAADLRRYLTDEPIRARPVGPVERVWRWIAKNPLPTTLLVAVTLAAAIGLWHLSRLSEKLLQSAALLSAVQQSDVLDEVNSFYSSEVVERVKPVGVDVTHDYKGHQGAIPAPATLTIELGNHISDKSNSGMRVRLYSQFPFKTRKDGGPRDKFEEDALAALIKDPDKPYYSFEEDSKSGKPILRYATARKMKESCVQCHNTHPDWPVHEDWKVGDVRGVLEIIRPLDKDIGRSTNESLQETFQLIAVICGSISALSVLALIIGHLRQRHEPVTTS
jgi:tRNA A-37 threonylcarbamoyl transferase component Bud32